MFLFLLTELIRLYFHDRKLPNFPGTLHFKNPPDVRCVKSIPSCGLHFVLSANGVVFYHFLVIIHIKSQMGLHFGSLKLSTNVHVLKCLSSGLTRPIRIIK